MLACEHLLSWSKLEHFPEPSYWSMRKTYWKTRYSWTCDMNIYLWENYAKFCWISYGERNGGNVNVVIIFIADRVTCRMLVLTNWPFVKASGCIDGQLTSFFVFHFTSCIMYLSFHIYPHLIISLQLLSLSSPLSDFQFLSTESLVPCHCNFCQFLRYSYCFLLFHATQLVSYKHIYSRINYPNSPASVAGNFSEPSGGGAIIRLLA